jgi:hypothetical protein
MDIIKNELTRLRTAKQILFIFFLNKQCQCLHACRKRLQLQYKITMCDEPNELSIPTINQTTFASQCKRETGSGQNGETDPDDRPCAIR